MSFVKVVEDIITQKLFLEMGKGTYLYDIVPLNLKEGANVFFVPKDTLEREMWDMTKFPSLKFGSDYSGFPYNTHHRVVNLEEYYLEE